MRKLILVEDLEYIPINYLNKYMIEIPFFSIEYYNVFKRNKEIILFKSLILKISKNNILDQKFICGDFYDRIKNENVRIIDKDFFFENRIKSLKEHMIKTDSKILFIKDADNYLFPSIKNKFEFETIEEKELFIKELKQY